MDERISRVLEKMKEKGIDQLLVSDPLSIRFLTGIMVNPGERLYALKYGSVTWMTRSVF